VTQKTTSYFKNSW